MQKVKRFLNDNKFFPPQSGNAARGAVLFFDKKACFYSRIKI